MQIWINKNGQQSGPFSIEEVRAMQIDVDSTYVWYEGLDNWILASKSALDFTAQPEPEPQEEVAEVETPQEAEPVEETAEAEEDKVFIAEPISKPQEQPVAEEQKPAEVKCVQCPYMKELQERECPPTNMIWAIISLICCCVPTGVVAIIYASKVRSAYYDGDFRKAEKYSEKAAGWTIAGYVLGILSQPLSILIYCL